MHSPAPWAVAVNRRVPGPGHGHAEGAEGTAHRQPLGLLHRPVVGLHLQAHGGALQGVVQAALAGVGDANEGQ